MTDDPVRRVGLDGILRLDEFQTLAETVMDPAAYAYYAGGAADEITLHENEAAFVRRRLRPRVLVDVADVDPSTAMLGEYVTMPVALAPNAAHMLADPEGECATARAAHAAGVLMCLSTFSNRSMEDVAAASPSPKWFQLYIHKDRGIAKEMIARAAAARYRAIVLTVDLPVAGYRERELRTPVEWGHGHAAPNLPVDTEGKSMTELLDGLVNASVTWDDLEWIRSSAGMPLIVKGIVTGEDAALALEHGADAVVVSNHGGRQLDRVPATIDVLEEIVDAVGGRGEVYLDGGVRRGTDVVTALALGARAVFVGRPYLFALALGGQRGVELCLQLLKAEVVNAMALLGTPAIRDITRAHIV